MNNKPYIDRTYQKFDSVMNLYARYLLKTTAKTDAVLALETADHLRLPPDDAAMTEIQPGVVEASHEKHIPVARVEGDTVVVEAISRFARNTKDLLFLVEELTKKTEDDMMKVRNLGRKSLEEVIAKLASLNLSLRDEDE